MSEVRGPARLDELYDVVVVGGGTAGWAAALAAAREGASVLLLERKGYVGGVLSSGLPINGFFDASQRQVIKGSADELVERLREVGGSSGYRLTDLWFAGQVFVDPALIKAVLLEMLQEAGVRLLLFSQVVDVARDGERIEHLVVQGRSGAFLCRGRTFVDSSGDAVLSFLSGSPLQSLDRLQPPTLVFRIENVDLPKLREHLADHPEDFMSGRMLPGRALTREFIRNTDFFFAFPGLTRQVEARGEYVPLIDRFMFTATPGGTGVVVNMLRARDADGTSSESLSRATVDLYTNLVPLVRFFRERIPGFERCTLCDAEPEVQLRETRRIVGDYTLTDEDVTEGRDFADSVAVGGYFIDIHSSTDSHGRWQLLERPYGIPYRTLLPQGLEGVLTAGRCISGTETAAASYRVMATCMAMGQAAGTAAALSSGTGKPPRELDPEKLRARLAEERAVVSVAEVERTGRADGA